MDKQENPMALSVVEMGKRLNLSRDVSYRLARSEGFPSVRIGGRIVIPVRELEGWLAAQVQKGQANGQPV